MDIKVVVVTELTNPATNINPQAKPIKHCRYECGKFIFRDDFIDGPPFMKWREMDTGIIHDLNRCCHVISEREKKGEGDRFNG